MSMIGRGKAMKITSGQLKDEFRWIARQAFLSGFATALIDEVGLSRENANERVHRLAQALPPEQIDALIMTVSDPATPRGQIHTIE